ncbi:hypothetical protein K493DRAFT_320704 [Basidiobolus meristosporus CBS 931.73]|uniref:Uncharacterized protein n=1 Tax=Basidiobolus meristosporus CBS 931.73 TaxID=1314790 RepID=A0A1Y1X7K6_9FUNG|nr:hypothetical protein K493DRAFT_320704 [Basidiobolus meristosporus CBS 931.73]|eukprot:ORX81314.1 hypothetical protein K493DRAFT_320704 [Basidiobolus meristosporus CBS 931.73]
MEWLAQTIRTVGATIAVLLFVIFCIFSAWYVVWKLILSKIGVFREIAGLQPPKPATKQRKKVTMQAFDHRETRSFRHSQPAHEDHSYNAERPRVRKNMHEESKPLIFESQYISP